MDYQRPHHAHQPQQVFFVEPAAVFGPAGPDIGADAAVLCPVAGEKVGQQVLGQVLPEEELSCLGVDISYHGGNPPPDFYDDLAGEEWFTSQKATAACYLESDLYDFYISVRAHDYRVEKLEEGQRQHLLGSLEELCQALEKEYGDNAKYDIYLGEGLTAEKGV